LNAGPPLRCPGGDLTLHKLWWGGCKRFTSGHGLAGTVSGVEAAIHSGDKIYFSVDMEVSLRDQRYSRQRYNNAGLSGATLRQRPYFPILCALTSVVEILTPLPTVQGTLQQRSCGGTRA